MGNASRESAKLEQEERNEERVIAVAEEEMQEGKRRVFLCSASV